MPIRQEDFFHGKTEGARLAGHFELQAIMNFEGELGAELN